MRAFVVGRARRSTLWIKTSAAADQTTTALPTNPMIRGTAKIAAENIRRIKAFLSVLEWRPGVTKPLSESSMRKLGPVHPRSKCGER
jgi:hypothetical protein